MLSDLLVFLSKALISVIVNIQVWHHIHSFVQDLWNSHKTFFFFVLWTFYVIFEENDDAELLSGTPKACVTHILICNDSSFGDKSVSDLLKRLPDAFNIWTMSSSQASHFAPVMFI